MILIFMIIIIIIITIILNMYSLIYSRIITVGDDAFCFIMIITIVTIVIAIIINAFLPPVPVIIFFIVSISVTNLIV